MPKHNVVFLSLAAILTPQVALACATCGCALSSDAAMGYSANAGWQISLQYDYINQNQLRSGSHAISPAQVAAINDSPGGDQEVENKTLNRYYTLGIGYSPNTDWNVKLLVPYIDRSHTTYGSSGNPLTADELSGSKISSLGDVKLVGSYQGFLPTHNLGVQLGVKLPTGDYGGPDAAGTGTVGHNPVRFNSGPGAGEILDTSLQAGTGSTDLIVGAYYYQPVSQNFDAFINGQFQSAVMHALDQPGADFRPGNQETVSLGLRYEARPDIVPQLQVNLSHKSADQGALADTADSAGTVIYLSPGVTVALAHKTLLYGFIQVPAYSHLDGYQLFPRWTATVGVSESL